MRLLGKTEIDFLGKRFITTMLSGAIIAASIVSLVIQGGPALGIDFAGGSQVIVLFAERPDVDRLRAELEGQGIESPQIQEFVADAGRNEILIRTPQRDDGEGSQQVVSDIHAALEAVEQPGAQAGKNDFNTVSRAVLTGGLLDSNPFEFDTVVDLEDAQQEYGRVADLVLGARDDVGLLSSWDGLSAIDVDPRVMQYLRDNFYFGGYAVVGQEFVGPQVGEDLRRQTLSAMTLALIGLLAYITYRFEFRFGLAAVAALVHDVTIAVGAFSLTGREFNLPVIAAFLTIIGYSLNDTVVIFDRIRENSQVLRRAPVYDRINTSINQTLSRTVLTSGTTMAVVLSLYFYGGPVINDFAFALLVGVVVGTYSSIFVASPIYYELVRAKATGASS